MKTRTFFVTASSVSCLVAVVAACGSTNRPSFGTVPDASVAYAEAGVTDAAFDFRACASGTHEAKLVPLDVYFMLDSSGSMLEPAGGGTSKWVAITQAMTSFVN